MISTKVHKEQAVMIVHTLGPKGTNCEKAGLLWLKNKGVRGEVRLYETLEEAPALLKKSTDWKKSNRGRRLSGCFNL
ncbi:hypothetical protein DT075_04165 [Bacillus licheniformis]|nr:hypothetical protein DT075_04165 [Bacillus licheniformis]